MGFQRRTPRQLQVEISEILGTGAEVDLPTLYRQEVQRSLMDERYSCPKEARVGQSESILHTRSSRHQNMILQGTEATDIVH